MLSCTLDTLAERVIYCNIHIIHMLPYTCNLMQ